MNITQSSWELLTLHFKDWIFLDLLMSESEEGGGSILIWWSHLKWLLSIARVCFHQVYDTSPSISTEDGTICKI